MAQEALHKQKTTKTKVRLPRAVQTTLTNFQNRALGLFPDAISRIVLYQRTPWGSTYIWAAPFVNENSIYPLENNLCQEGVSELVSV
jgi:hypothetical protein